MEVAIGLLVVTQFEQNDEFAVLQHQGGCTFHRTGFSLVFSKFSKLFCSDLRFRFVVYRL